MKHQPERTCIGCRNVFPKEEVLRIVAGPDGIAIDYREKLPGRAAYVCPKRECITRALSKDGLAKALHLRIKLPGVEEFIVLLTAIIEEKIKSLVSVSGKADKLAAGFSAVQDSLGKGRIKILLFARDFSEGTKGKLTLPADTQVRQATLLTRDEFGELFGRELVGVVGIEDKGLADAVWRETERLKGLINNGE